MTPAYSPAKLASLAQREAASFTQTHPLSAQLAEQAKQYLYGGVPMHWMAAWSTPFPLVRPEASGAPLIDVDGHSCPQFCPA